MKASQGTPYATIKGPDPSNPTPFHFDDPGLDLTVYDEIWLFGYEGMNDGTVAGPAGPGEPGDLSDSELAKITAFMEQGGGVFATGDHDGLGAGMCGRIPRVRYLRKWHSIGDTNAPPLAVGNWPGGGPTRADSLKQSPTDTQVNNANVPIFNFDDQSDDIPQPLNVLVPTHPAVQGATGVLSVYPDHMHEGEVIAPGGAQLTQTYPNDSTLSFAGAGFEEFPTLSGGYQAPPMILAQNTVGQSGTIMGHVTAVGESMPCENINFHSDGTVSGVRTNAAH